MALYDFSPVLCVRELGCLQLRWHVVASSRVEPSRASRVFVGIAGDRGDQDLAGQGRRPIRAASRLRRPQDVLQGTGAPQENGSRTSRRCIMVTCSCHHVVFFRP